jgi:hypothetical protein
VLLRDAVNRDYILVVATKRPGVIRYEGIQDIKLKFVIPVELLTYRAVNMLRRVHPLSAEQVLTTLSECSAVGLRQVFPALQGTQRW